MAWSLEGNYFENCSCDTICPCTWSAFTATATHDRCLAMLAFHMDRGDIDGVDVSGLSFALVIDSPPVMSDGGWRLGVVVDDAADASQSATLGQVLGGELGGPPAMLGPLIGEVAGIEQASTTWSQSDGSFSVRFGDLIDVEVANFVSGALTEPVHVANVFHPANTTLTVSPATRSHAWMPSASVSTGPVRAASTRLSPGRHDRFGGNRRPSDVPYHADDDRTACACRAGVGGRNRVGTRPRQRSGHHGDIRHSVPRDVDVDDDGDDAPCRLSGPSLYAQTIRTRRATHVPIFVGGYLLAWAAAGIPPTRPCASSIISPAIRMLRCTPSPSSFSSQPVVPTDATQDPLSAALSFTARPTPALRQRQGSWPRPQGRLAPRRLLPRMLLGTHAALRRLRRHERLGHGRPRRRHLRREARPTRRHFTRSIGVACLVLAALVTVSPTIAHKIIPATDTTTMTNSM